MYQALINDRKRAEAAFHARIHAELDRLADEPRPASEELLFDPTSFPGETPLRNRLEAGRAEAAERAIVDSLKGRPKPPPAEYHGLIRYAVYADEESPRFLLGYVTASNGAYALQKAVFKWYRNCAFLPRLILREAAYLARSDKATLDQVDERLDHGGRLIRTQGPNGKERLDLADLNTWDGPDSQRG